MISAILEFSLRQRAVVLLGTAALLGVAPAWYHGLAFVLIAAGILVSSR